MIKKYAIFINGEFFCLDDDKVGQNKLLYSFDTIEPMLDWLRLNNLAIEFSIATPIAEPPSNLLPHLIGFDCGIWEWRPKYPLFYGQEIYV